MVNNSNSEDFSIYLFFYAIANIAFLVSILLSHNYLT